MKEAEKAIEYLTLALTLDSGLEFAQNVLLSLTKK